MIRIHDYLGQIQLIAEQTALTPEGNYNSHDQNAIRPQKPLNLSGSKIINITKLDSPVQLKEIFQR